MAVPNQARAGTTPADAPAPNQLLAQMRAPDRSGLGVEVRMVAPPNQPFFKGHHPECWDCEPLKGEVEGVKLDGNFWLPQIADFPVVPGTNGFRLVPKGQPKEAAWLDALDKLKRRGFTMLDQWAAIDAAYLPAGVPVGGYFRELPCVDALTGQHGTHYLDAWTVPLESLPGRPTQTRFDRPSYNRWRASLILRGIIAPPIAVALAPIVRALHERIERAKVLPMDKALRDARVAKAEAAVAIAEKATPPRAPAAEKS